VGREGNVLTSLATVSLSHINMPSVGTSAVTCLPSVYMKCPCGSNLQPDTTDLMLQVLE